VKDQEEEIGIFKPLVKPRPEGGTFDSQSKVGIPKSTLLVYCDWFFLEVQGNPKHE
jgi:hypothetical protein